MKRIPLIVITGPTASGKTALSVRLAEAFSGEIVSADSMQIYRGMRIATAKPSRDEMRGIPHHLTDFADPGEAFSVADYVRLAGGAIRDISARGKQPFLVGGTGLYISSLIDHISFEEIESDETLRRELTEQIGREGGEAFLKKLSTFDPETAALLHPNDSGRIVRAFEVFQLTGVPMSELRRRSRLSPSPYSVLMIGLTARDRDFLYSRIDRRVDRMMEEGLLEEARDVLSRDGMKTAGQAIGYKELKRYFDGECPLEEAVATLKRETRRYAKRQLTWFRRDKRVRWLYIDETDEDGLFEQAGQMIEDEGWRKGEEDEEYEPAGRISKRGQEGP